MFVRSHYGLQSLDGSHCKVVRSKSEHTHPGVVTNFQNKQGSRKVETKCTSMESSKKRLQSYSEAKHGSFLGFSFYTVIQAPLNQNFSGKKQRGKMELMELPKVLQKQKEKVS